MKKYFLILLAIIIIGIVLIDQRDKLTFLPSITLSPTPANPIAEEILPNLPFWLPNTTWTTPSVTSMNTFYGSLVGEYAMTTVTSGQPRMDHFENVDLLASNGFHPDLNLAADGPGSSTWGYKKTADEQSQVVIFSYITTPTTIKSDEPVAFSCPCTVTVSAFVSNPF